jgi:NAD(P)H dehydrogenase (quinone)
MNVLVMYYSRSGNTKRLAEAIADGVREIDGISCVLKDAGEVNKDDFLASEGIIAGSPVYFGTMAAELKKVFDSNIGVRNKMEGKVGAAFTTAAASAGGKETTIMTIFQAMLIYGMIICGDPMDATGHYGVSSTGAPGDAEIENGKKLGRRVARLVKKLRAQ